MRETNSFLPFSSRPHFFFFFAASLNPLLWNDFLLYSVKKHVALQIFLSDNSQQLVVVSYFSQNWKRLGSPMFVWWENSIYHQHEMRKGRNKQRTMVTTTSSYQYCLVVITTKLWLLAVWRWVSFPLTLDYVTMEMLFVCSTEIKGGN